MINVKAVGQCLPVTAARNAFFRPSEIYALEWPRLKHEPVAITVN